MRQLVLDQYKKGFINVNVGINVPSVKVDKIACKVSSTSLRETALLCLLSLEDKYL